jgi:hypothetical protein
MSEKFSKDIEVLFFLIFPLFICAYNDCRGSLKNNSGDEKFNKPNKKHSGKHH